MRVKYLRIFVFLLLVGGVVTSCRATDETRRGDVDEFCNNRDDDCRTGLVCEDGVCSEPGGGAAYSCNDVCARLEACEAAEPNCVPDCRVTIDGWSTRAVDAFGACIVEDITCAEARESFAPQLCYTRIPIPEGREERCQSFLETALNCAPDARTTELRDRCYELARVGSEEQWGETERCVNAIEVGVCSGIATCFNDELELDPPIELGESTLD